PRGTSPPATPCPGSAPPSACPPSRSVPPPTASPAASPTSTASMGSAPDRSSTPPSPPSPSEGATMHRKNVAVAGVLALAALALSPARSGAATATAAGSPRTTVVTYDNFEKPGGYTLADYFQKWSNKLGPGEMAVRETRKFDGGGFFVDAAPFRTAHDSGILDHIKYFAASRQHSLVPPHGSL